MRKAIKHLHIKIIVLMKNLSKFFRILANYCYTPRFNHENG